MNKKYCTFIWILQQVSGTIVVIYILYSCRHCKSSVAEEEDIIVLDYATYVHKCIVCSLRNRRNKSRKWYYILIICTSNSALVGALLSFLYYIVTRIICSCNNGVPRLLWVGCKWYFYKVGQSIHIRTL